MKERRNSGDHSDSTRKKEVKWMAEGKNLTKSWNKDGWVGWREIIEKQIREWTVKD